MIHNGFNFKRIADLDPKDSIKNKLDIKTNKVIGMVANFTSNKDYTTFIKAAENLLEREKNLTFLAVGDGILFEKTKHSVRPIYKDKIRFLGRQKDVEAVVNTFDIAVLSTNGEGISNVILEYMALRKPVIATDCSGNREIIHNGINGFLIPANSVNDLVNKIDYILQNENIIIKMGKLGEGRILEEFNSEKMVARYCHLYKDMHESNMKDYRNKQISLDT